MTVNRADYAIVLPVLRRLRDDPGIDLHLLVSGAHLAPEFGRTERAIVADGFEIRSRVEMLLSSDSPEGIAKSVGLGVQGFAQVFAHSRPDVLLVSADRFEMFSAAIAALPFHIVTAHIEGGDLTEGAIDDSIRHSITKLSHLHFVSTTEYGERVAQLGEEPWRITVSGAPSLDNLTEVEFLSAAELERKYAIPMTPPPLLVTFHPVTLEFEQTAQQVGELLAALATTELPLVITMPNADTSGRIIADALQEFAAGRPATRLVDNLGTRDYLSMMRHASAMVGNSSSGLIEAPSFKLPVVNVGNRQRGRTRAANVIDVAADRAEIERAIRVATSDSFRAGLAHLENPYGSGNAAAVIVERLKEVDLNDPRLLLKRFHDPRAVHA